MLKMMGKYFSIAAISGLTLCMTGCVTNQDVGMVAGGVAGGLLGNQIGGGAGRTVATVAGTIVGGMLGGSVGQAMDRQDQMMLQQAMVEDRPTTWKNQNTGKKYHVVPGRNTGQGCRNFTMYAFIDGHKEPINGRACYRNGRWQVVS